MSFLVVVILTILFASSAEGGLVVLIANLLEDRQASLLGHSNIESAHVGVRNQVNSRLHNGSVLIEQVLEASPLTIEVRKIC